MSPSKGISPLVASVLLIAIAIAIGGLLSFWALNTWFPNQLSQFNSTEQDCIYVDFAIYSCSYNSTSGNILLNLQNTQKITLSDLGAYVTYTNGSLSGIIKLNGSLAVSDIKGYTLTNTTTNISTGFSKIIIVSLNCPGKSHESTCVRY